MVNAMRFLAGMAVLAALATPVMSQDTTADTVVATVNGTNITVGHMIVARNSLPEEYKTLPNDVLFKGILDQLVQQTLLQQSVGDRVAKRDALAMENDNRGYLSNVALQAVISVAVTDAALQAAYDARFKDAKPGTEYSAAHILVETEEKAIELKKQLDAGGDFAALAKANSTDTGSGANGGDLGWFGLGAMVKPFEDAVVAAEVSKVAGPIKSDFGWHLILVKETRAAAQPTLDDLRDELATEIEQKSVEAHLKTLTDAAKIEKPGEATDPAVLTDLSLLDK